MERLGCLPAKAAFSHHGRAVVPLSPPPPPRSCKGRARRKREGEIHSNSPPPTVSFAPPPHRFQWHPCLFRPSLGLSHHTKGRPLRRLEGKKEAEAKKVGPSPPPHRAIDPTHSLASRTATEEGENATPSHAKGGETWGVCRHGHAEVRWCGAPRAWVGSGGPMARRSHGGSCRQCGTRVHEENIPPHHHEG